MQWFFCALSVVICLGCNGSKGEDTPLRREIPANAHEVELRFDAGESFPAHAITLQWMGVAQQSEVVPVVSGALHEMAVQCLTPQQWAIPGGLFFQVDLARAGVDTNASLTPRGQRCLDEKSGVLAQSLRGLQIERAMVRISRRQLGEPHPGGSPDLP